jgi:hypothetical protein
MHLKKERPWLIFYLITITTNKNFSLYFRYWDECTHSQQDQFWISKLQVVYIIFSNSATFRSFDVHTYFKMKKWPNITSMCQWNWNLIEYRTGTGNPRVKCLQWKGKKELFWRSGGAESLRHKTAIKMHVLLSVCPLRSILLPLNRLISVKFGTNIVPLEATLYWYQHQHQHKSEGIYAVISGGLKKPLKIGIITAGPCQNSNCYLRNEIQTCDC